MAYDLDVANAAWRTANELHASPKVLLSLFEAGIVESGFRNLATATDHDSVGFLQQRPSQGWPDPMNVVTATKSFVSRATPIQDRYTTAGKLAQAVQRSAFPDRYDQAQGAAEKLLGQVRGGSGGGVLGSVGGVLGGLVDGTDDGLIGAVRGVGDGLRTIASGAAPVGKLAELTTKLALPSNAIRAVSGLLGIVFIFIGIAQLGREVRR
jgi:hypothetical protein